MTKIIGLAGPKGCGKSTIAQELARILRVDGERIITPSFADPMRAMLETLMTYGGVDNPWHQMEDRTLKEAPIAGLAGASYRTLAQTLGTEWGRNCVSPTLWTDICMGTIKRSLAAWAIIDDVRFPEEVEAIVSRGGRVVNLDRVGCGASTLHVSEAGVDAPTFRNNELSDTVARRILGWCNGQ